MLNFKLFKVFGSAKRIKAGFSENLLQTSYDPNLFFILLGVHDDAKAGLQALKMGGGNSLTFSNSRFKLTHYCLN